MPTDHRNCDYDDAIKQVADYVVDYRINSALAFDTAYYNLLDSMACALQALAYRECRQVLGPLVKGAELVPGARIPGTPWQLDPVQAAFNFGTMIRWLDYNDTWLAAEWGHPSDNLGGLLMLADYLNRQRRTQLSVHDLLHYQIKAHEIQGIFALANSFNAMGLDHVILVKIASTAVASHLLGGTKETICRALSNAWLDGHSLRTYRHSPNTGSRKSWAAGDATSRAIRLSLLAEQGAMGYPSALSAPNWGFYAVYCNNQPFQLNQPLTSYVMENVLFKLLPAEFHAQTAAECALALHSQVKQRLQQIQSIDITTHQAAMRIIHKQGPLHNPADRDHCLEYIVAVALIYGEITPQHYQANIASDPRIDQLRALMHVKENKQFSLDYLDPNKRAIANSLEITFSDGSKTEPLTIHYPTGHPQRRQEAIPLILEKFEKSVTDFFPLPQAERIIDQCATKERLLDYQVDEFINFFVTSKQLWEVS